MKFTHFDAHTHTQFEAYDEDRDAVIARAHDAGIGIINVGSDKKMSITAVELARKYVDGVYATVGLHPADADEGFDYEFYKELAHDKRVVAIGECGLDFFRIEEGCDIEKVKEKQYEIFLAQIKLSHEIRKPLMIHCRNAMPELIEFLKANKTHLVDSSVMHFFSGTPEEAKNFLSLILFHVRRSYYIRTRLRRNGVRDSNKPSLSETDAPYVTPVPIVEKMSQCSCLKLRKLAELKKSSNRNGKSYSQNIQKVFQLP